MIQNCSGEILFGILDFDYNGSRMDVKTDFKRNRSCGDMTIVKNSTGLDYGVLTVDLWNDAVVSILMPLTIILILYLIIGFFGNISVLYIYWWQIRTPSKDRYFIPILAMVDMATCGICAGAGVYANLNPLKFESDVGCKIVAYISVVFATVSADLLVIIAVDRFLKICFPFGTQMTLRWKRLSLVILFAVSFIIALPAFFVYGSVPVKHPVYNLTGWRCVNIAQNGRHHVWELLYKGVLFDYVAIRFIALTLMYVRIGKNVYKHLRRHTKMLEPPGSSNGTFQSIHTNRQSIVVQHEKGNNPGFLEKLLCKTSNVRNEDIDRETRVNGSERTQSHRSNRKGLRLTLIFLLITGIYILTFGPKVVLMVFETMNVNFWTTMTAGELVGFRFLYTLFIVNNVVNPFIYGFLDEQFRKELCKFCWYSHRR